MVGVGNVGDVSFSSSTNVVQKRLLQSVGLLLMRLIQASETASPASDFLLRRPTEGNLPGTFSILDGWEDHKL